VGHYGKFEKAAEELLKKQSLSAHELKTLIGLAYFLAQPHDPSLFPSHESTEAARRYKNFELAWRGYNRYLKQADTGWPDYGKVLLNTWALVSDLSNNNSESLFDLSKQTAEYFEVESAERESLVFILGQVAELVQNAQTEHLSVDLIHFSIQVHDRLELPSRKSICAICIGGLMVSLDDYVFLDIAIEKLNEAVISENSAFMFFQSEDNPKVDIVAQQHRFLNVVNILLELVKVKNSKLIELQDYAGVIDSLINLDLNMFRAFSFVKYAHLYEVLILTLNEEGQDQMVSETLKSMQRGFQTAIINLTRRREVALGDEQLTLDMQIAELGYFQDEFFVDLVSKLETYAGSGYYLTTPSNVGVIDKGRFGYSARL